MSRVKSHPTKESILRDLQSRPIDLYKSLSDLCDLTQKPDRVEDQPLRVSDILPKNYPYLPTEID